MEIRQAQAEDTELVAQVLTAAATELVRKGQAPWDLPGVAAAAIEQDVRAGAFFIATDAQGPVAVFRFQLEDPHYWPEIAQGSSAFVHRLAVHPRAQGRGLAHAMLRHACELARRHGRQHLRLDCASGRPRLRSVYEGFGFTFHSQRQMSRLLVDRFELCLQGLPTAGPPRYRAALFDLDDTLFDHQLHRREALAALREALPMLRAVSVTELEHAHDQHLQRTHRALLAGALTLEQARTQRLRGVLSDFGHDASDEQIAIAEAAYRRAYDGDWRAVPGAQQLLRRLREAGLRIAVITNGRTAEQLAKIEALGLQDAVDDVFISEAVGAEKPSREFFDHVLERLSLPCTDCIVIGDLWETDIQGAIAAGIDAVWLNRYQRTRLPADRVREITSLEPLDVTLALFLQPS